MASDEGKKIALRSSDGEEFVVDEAVAMLSQTIRHTIEDGCADSGIPLPNVNSKILAKVIEYCKKHVECTPVPSASSDDKSLEEELKNWDSDFVKVDQATLFDLILVLQYSPDPALGHYLLPDPGSPPPKPILPRPPQPAPGNTPTKRRPPCCGSWIYPFEKIKGRRMKEKKEDKKELE